jgi:hypothetical protein
MVAYASMKSQSINPAVTSVGGSSSTSLTCRNHFAWLRRVQQQRVGELVCQSGVNRWLLLSEVSKHLAGSAVNVAAVAAVCCLQARRVQGRDGG